MRWVVAILAGLLLVPGFAGAWVHVHVGDGASRIVGLFHGDPDRNGTPEVYGANATALLRFTFAGGTWRQERIMDVRAGIQSLAVGDGDRDGKQEVWFGTPGGSAVRLRWTDSGLVKDVHALGSGPVRALLVGDADADGKPEVYAALGKTVWKLARESTGWEKTAIVDTNDAVSAMSFGYGDRTPVRKLWLGTTHGDLWRVRYHEGAWTLRHVGNGTPGQALHAVDNLEFFDGYPRPVVLSDDGRAYAFARANTTAPFERRTLATFPHDPVALSNFEVVTEGGFLYRMDQHGRALEIGRGEPFGAVLSLPVPNHPFRHRVFAGSEAGSVTRWSVGAEVVAHLPERAAKAPTLWDGTSLWAFGGWDEQAATFLPTVQRFTPATGEATRENITLPGDPTGLTGVWDPQRQRGYLLGAPRVWVFDPANRTVAEGATWGFTLTGASAVFDGRYAYFFGGQESGADRADVFRYDPVADVVATFNATLPSARHGTAAVWAGDRAYVVGGFVNGSAVRQVVEFVPSGGSGSVAVVGHLQRAAGGASAVWNGSAMFVFTGGHAFFQRWEPSGSRATLLDSVPAFPAERTWSGAAWAGDRAYVVGGMIADYGRPDDRVVAFRT